jgi:signal peptidase I
MNKKDTANNRPSKKTVKQEFFSLIRFTLMTLAIIIPIRIFIAQPFVVNGDSMYPSLKSGDYLIIDEITYKTQDVQRGDVIVFRFPAPDTKRFLIKRVIGLPGEMVSLNGDRIVITKHDGSVIQIQEDYINTGFSSYGTWELDVDEYFVMGDNRGASSDSRSWGVLDKEYIVGKTLLRLFPLSKITTYPAEHQPKDIEIVIEPSNE